MFLEYSSIQVGIAAPLTFSIHQGIGIGYLEMII